MRKSNLSVIVAVSFRIPMPVKEVVVFKNGGSFPKCPKCSITIEREYQRFCDRCGQALNWDEYHNVNIIYAP